MDFIEGLPRSGGKTIVLEVVDRLSKFAHFIALSHPFTARIVAASYIENVYKLYGTPRTIVSDRDGLFLSEFWKEFWAMQGSKLLYNTTFYPQIDGQTEVVNMCLENYLRCFCSNKPWDWVKWLAWARFWYNTSWHCSIKVSPYQALYGRRLPPLLTILLELPGCNWLRMN